MKYGIQLVANQSDTPVSLAEAKAHLRVDWDADDPVITSLIYAASETVEGKLRRSVFKQTWKMTLDQFPYPVDLATVTPSQRDEYLFPAQFYSYYQIELPRTKVASVSSIVYTANDGTPVTLDPSTYSVDVNSEPARIVPSNGGSWPYVGSLIPGSIAITFIAGVWDFRTVPRSIKIAILLMVGHLYANRNATTEENLKVLPMGVDSLLERWLYYGP